MLLDTNVLIHLIRAFPRAVRWAQGWATVPACSEVSRAEILRGARAAEMANTESLFADLAWIPVTEVIARRAGALGREWGRQAHDLPDLLIAATALEAGLEIVTINVRDYPMFPGLHRPY